MYDDAIQETGRLTGRKKELSEDAKLVLDRKQSRLMEKIASQPEITVTYFFKDERKAGGTYQTASGGLKHIDEQQRLLILSDGKKIPLDDILDIKSDVFQEWI